MGTPRYSRKWKVYVIQHVHGMLGWARSYDEAQTYYELEIANQLDLMDKSDGFPDEAKHRFVVDCTWIIREYLKRRPDDSGRVRRRLHEGRLELGDYEASVTDFCFNGEELLRCLGTRAALERGGYGRTEMTVFSDVHAFSFGMPSLLAGSGIKYVLAGSNSNPRCGFLRWPGRDIIPRGHALFRWEGIDGKQVLCFHFGDYVEASNDSRGGEFNASFLAPFLERFEAMGDAYPYDAVVMFGTGGDAILSGVIHGTLLSTERIREWNETMGGADPDNLDAPMLINGCAEQFFHYVEEKYGDRIPVFAGGWGGGAWLWDTQAQRFAKTGLYVRQSSARLRMAELLAAANHALFGAAYPKAAIEDVIQYRIWHDEHDANGTRPYVTNAIKQEWRAINQRWGREELEQPTMELLDTGLQLLAAQLPRVAAREIVVFNPLARPRRDVARWACTAPAAGKMWQVVDPATGATLPSQYVREGEKGYLLFLVQELPSLGYKKYAVQEVAAVPDARESASPGAATSAIENDAFRVRCDETGAIVSIWDKRHDRELVRPDAPFNVYVNTGFKITEATVTLENQGPVGCNLVIHAHEGAPFNTKRYTGRIWLYQGLDRIDMVNEFEIEDRDQDVYFDFPLALNGPLTYTLEGPSSSILTAGQNEFDETRGEHWNVFSFVDAADADYGVTLLSPDARQFYLGGRVIDTIMPQSDLSYPALVTRVIGGGPRDQDWCDPNGGPADNPYSYRFSLLGHAGAVDVVAALDAGWGQLYPLQVQEIGGQSAGANLPASASFWRVPAPLVITAFKYAEAGDDHDYIVRLWNPTATPVQGARLESDLFEVTRARINDHLERDTGPDAALAGGGCTVDVGPRAVVTLRVTISTPSIQP